MTQLTLYTFVEIQEKRVECVLDGRMRANYSILDLTLSEIQSACFIERDAQYVAVVNEMGGIYILDTETGNLVNLVKRYIVYVFHNVQFHNFIHSM